MKKYIDGIKIGLGFLSVIIIFGLVTFYLVKAWSGTGNLTSSPGDKLTFTTWNNFVNQVNSLSGYVSTKTNVIVCNKSASGEPSGSNSQGKTISFNASECGGTLPDDTYIGTVAKLSICGIATDPVVTSNPTQLFLRMYMAYCGSYNVSVFYIKK